MSNMSNYAEVGHAAGERPREIYSVTIQVVPNIPLTSKLKFSFSMRPKSRGFNDHMS